MLKSQNNKKLAITFFVIALIAALTIFGLSIIKTWIFNQAEHFVTFAGQELLAANEAQSKEVHVSAGARSATWSKAFDFHNEGITEHTRPTRMTSRSQTIRGMKLTRSSSS